MSDALSPRPEPRPRPERRSVGCGGCLITVLLTMVLSGALIWALNPGMSVEEAARGGILVGGGLSAATIGLLCAIPAAIVGVALLVVVVAGLRAARRAREAGGPAPSVIDVEADDLDA
jgi:hypothetical protein